MPEALHSLCNALAVVFDQGQWWVWLGWQQHTIAVSKASEGKDEAA